MSKVDISSEAVERYQPDRFDDLAYWFWSIHPREIPDPEGMPKGYLGGARAWMYAKAIREVVAATRTEAQQETQATLRAQAERIKELEHFLVQEKKIAEKDHGVWCDNYAALDRRYKTARNDALREAVQSIRDHSEVARRSAPPPHEGIGGQTKERA